MYSFHLSATSLYSIIFFLPLNLYRCCPSYFQNIFLSSDALSQSECLKSIYRLICISFNPLFLYFLCLSIYQVSETLILSYIMAFLLSLPWIPHVPLSKLIVRQTFCIFCRALIALLISSHFFQLFMYFFNQLVRESHTDKLIEEVQHVVGMYVCIIGRSYSYPLNVNYIFLHYKVRSFLLFFPFFGVLFPLPLFHPYRQSRSLSEVAVLI